jgi:hypothetical protein
MRNRNVRVPVPMVPRSSLVTPSAIQGQFIYLPMNEGTGVDLTDWGGQGLFDSDAISMAAAGSGQWDNLGWFTPDSTNHHATVAKDDNAALRAFMNLETLTGGMLVMYDLWVGQTPNANSVIFANHYTQSTRGGWGVHINTSRQLVWSQRPPAGASQDSDVIATLGTSQRLAIVHYLDIANVSSNSYSVYNYINGVAGNTSAISGPLPEDFSSASNGFCLFANNNAGTVQNKLNGAGTPANARVARFFMKRCLSDESSKIAAIAQESAKQPELPKALLTLGA